MTVAIWPFEAMPVMEQHPSWLDDGHELTVTVPLVHVAALAGIVMHSDMSEDEQLMVPPPPPLEDPPELPFELPPEPLLPEPLLPELLLEPAPASPPPPALPPQAMSSAGTAASTRTRAKLR